MDATTTFDAKSAGTATSDETAALRLLGETLGVAFRTWNGATGAAHSGGNLPDEVCDTQVQVAAAQLGGGESRHAVPLEGDRVLIAFRLPDEAGSLVTAVLPTRDVGLASKLAAAAERLLLQQLAFQRQGRELTACLEQLSFSMEEQVWLRSLSRQIDRLSGRLDLSAMLTEILPRLRHLIAAESVAFLPAEIVDSPRGAAAVSWSGNQRLGAGACRRLIAAFGSQAARRAVVIQEADAPELLGPLGVRSLVLASVAQRQGIGGWLLAVNRSRDLLPILQGISFRRPKPGDDEFHTVEAGLMEATATMLSSHVRNADALQQREGMIVRLMKTMSSAIDARDAYTRGHSQRVGRYALAIGRQLRLTDHDCEQLYLAGLLHDLGKIGVPDHVLLKPGRLSPEEFDLIKMHPEIGYRILEPIAELAFALPGVLHHHERLDGRGYPHGLAGEQIPLMARILAAADAYDAMTSSRTYRTAMSNERAREILGEGAGMQWDPQVVAAFLSAVQPLPGPDATPEDESLTISPSIFDDDDRRGEWENHSMLLDTAWLEPTEIML